MAETKKKKTAAKKPTAAASKVGGSGIRYTIRINGRETFLFEDEATSIEQISEKVSDDAVIYDLMGRRVSKMQDGHIYIVNGKKILKK